MKIFKRVKTFGLMCCMSTAFFVLSNPASAQYIRESILGEQSTPEQNEQPQNDSPVIYNPYIPQQQQTTRPTRQQGQSEETRSINPLGPMQKELLGSLMSDFVEQSQRDPAALFKFDPNAPKRSELVSLTVLPDDPMRYCEDYDEKNPPELDVQAYMETYLRERIKPASQMNMMIPKGCLGKMSDIAQKMLVDYTAFKRNDFITRAGDNIAAQRSGAQKGNKLRNANLAYLNLARSECEVSRQDASSDTVQRSKMVESCVIQMLKRRIQNIAAM